MASKRASSFLRAREWVLRPLDKMCFFFLYLCPKQGGTYEDLANSTYWVFGFADYAVESAKCWDWDGNPSFFGEVAR
jgi:hypothetical protein